MNCAVEILSILQVFMNEAYFNVSLLIHSFTRPLKGETTANSDQVKPKAVYDTFLYLEEISSLQS